MLNGIGSSNLEIMRLLIETSNAKHQIDQGGMSNTSQWISLGRDKWNMKHSGDPYIKSTKSSSIFFF